MRTKLKMLICTLPFPPFSANPQASNLVRESAASSVTSGTSAPAPMRQALPPPRRGSPSARLSLNLSGETNESSADVAAAMKLPELERTPKSGRQHIRPRSQSMLALREEKAGSSNLLAELQQAGDEKPRPPRPGQSSGSHTEMRTPATASQRSPLGNGVGYSVGTPPAPVWRSSEDSAEHPAAAESPTIERKNSSINEAAILTTRLARSEQRVALLERDVTTLQERMRRLRLERDALALDNDRLRRLSNASPSLFGAAATAVGATVTASSVTGSVIGSGTDILSNGSGLAGAGGVAPLTLSRGVAFDNMSSTNV